MDKTLLVANQPKDQLVVTKLDRLGRSLEHLIELSKTLQDRGGDLVVLDRGSDTSTAVGCMFFQILSATAEFEHALLSERTRVTLPPPAPVDAPAVRNPNSGTRSERHGYHDRHERTWRYPRHSHHPQRFDEREIENEPARSNKSAL
ncbi:recombinase family protein [Nocardia sp. NBC_00403]|uniref:recombinase family protein n=1 Tax=Nocardia sp. NBC_00403 TaxID=2975990 RepID=UPI002E1BD517